MIRVHMIGHKNGAELEVMGADVSTLCGESGCPIDGVPTRYTLANRNGSSIQATTRKRFTSCRKCLNLMTFGTLHERKILAPRSKPLARPIGRPKGGRIREDIVQ